MNFHSRHWGEAEEATLVAMRADGRPYHEIAGRLGRGLTTIKVHAYRLGLSKQHARKFKPGPPLPRLTILKADLPMIYEHGWRVVGFSGDVVQLEWPHKTNPYHDDLVTTLISESRERNLG